MERENNIHQRLLKLKDVAMGVEKAIPVNSPLAPASYDCAVDSLLALFNECKGASTLAKDKNVLKFINKYESTVSALNKIRISADDFEIKSTIGRGHFGEVMLCKEKSTGDIFAMKVMKKAHILQQPDAAFYSAERDIMVWSSSPWLTTLHYAFQDAASLYLIMDYHPGGDLLTIMERKEGSMQEEEARFYLAETAAGLHDLHQLGFVHRDVKPENVLIARSGHIKLVDFGSAARLDSNGKVIESQLPVGTPEYISPEVLTSLDRTADYGVCCDWWSLGVIAYELLYDTTPFEGESTSKTYNNVMSYKKGLSFPEEPRVSEEARDLIQKLLSDMKTRLTYSQIQNHPFFALTDWSHLLHATPPHIPTVSGPDDVSNFDSFEPCKDDDLRYPDFPSRSREFSGKSLPFVGFTFSGVGSSEVTSKDLTDSSRLPLEGVALEGGPQELRHTLELVRKEAEEEKAKRMSLEKECVIYQSQLEDYHRKLEMEKSDRRVLDSQALQLLQEVKEKGRLAQQLREEQARSTEREYRVVVEQLERERQEASRRSQRLQEKLKELQKERDTALRKAADYRTKQTEAKEAARKEITGLQARLSKLSKEFSAKIDEIRERYNDSLAKKEKVEAAKRKAEMELKALQATTENASSTTEDLNKQLKDFKSSCEELQAKLNKHSKTNEYLEKHSASLEEQLKKLQAQLDEVHSQNKLLESEWFSLEQQHRVLEVQLEEMRAEREKLVSGKEATSKTMSAKVTELQNAKKEVSSLKDKCNSLEAKLKEAESLHQASHKTDGARERLKASAKKAAELEKENQKLKGNLSAMNTDLQNKSKEAKKLKERLEEVERENSAAQTALSGQVQELQDQLKESKSALLLEEDKLRELRKVERELTQHNADLTTKLSLAEAESGKVAKQLKKATQDLSKLKSVKDSYKLAEIKIKALQIDSDLARKEMTVAQEEMRKMAMAKDEAEQMSSCSKKQYEEQELTTALLQRNVKFLKEELKEVRSATLDAQKQQAHWKTVKETVEADLEVAESKLEEACANIEKEKKARQAAEQRMSEVAEEMEKLLSKHAEELEQISDQLLSQKELSTKYSMRVLELEKDIRIKALNHKETQKELSTEKAVSSKFYDEVQLKSRELNKLKATHMKLVREMQQVTGKVAQLEELLGQQRAASERQQLQETRLQATISQQGKLIDYLQGVGRSPENKGLGRLKVKLGRKGRDPAREIAEWNKLKGIAGKGHSSGIVQSTSSTSMSQPSLASSTSLPSPPHASTTTDMPRADQPAAQHTSQDQTTAMEHSSGSQQAHVVTFTTLPDSGTTTGSGSATGTKHKSAEATTDANEIFGHHNIPHKFRGISKSGLRSSYTCAACKAPIKARQKLIKCSHCHIPCHVHCIDSLSQNCGLPVELSSYIKVNKQKRPNQKEASELSDDKAKDSGTPQEQETAPPPPKRPKKGERVVLLTASQPMELGPVAVCERVPVLSEKTSLDKKAGKKGDEAKLRKVALVSSVQEEKDTLSRDGGSASLKLKGEVTLHRSPQASRGSGSAKGSNAKSGSVEEINEARHVKSIYEGFELSKVIKMEQTSQPRGGMMTEGWLVLTAETLCLYDRDPRGVTRKPIHKFRLGDPGTAYVVLPSVTRQTFPQLSTTHVVRAFGLQVLSTSQCKDLCFVAGSLQSKIEWVEAIQKVLTSHTCPPPAQQVMKEASPRGRMFTPPKGGGRELKAVSIVPLSASAVKTPQNERGWSSPAPPGGGSGEDSMELSIRSSMMDSSSGSDTSYI